MRFDEIKERYLQRREVFDKMDPVSRTVELRTWYSDFLAALEQDETISAERRADLLPVFSGELRKIEAVLADHEKLITKVMNETFETVTYGR